jgi:hypothetical protein
MSYRKIIAEAWLYTQQNKKLIYWFGFLPSIFTTTAGVLYLGYQFFAFKKSELFEHAQQSFLQDVVSFVFGFLSKHAQSSWIILLVVAFLVLIYLLLPTLMQAAAIQVIARHRNGQEATVADGIRFGLGSYLPLFEYHAVVKVFGMVTILFESAFVLRQSVDLFMVLLPVFVIFLIVGVIMTLLFTYADLYIIIDGEGVVASITKSAKIVLLHWQKTFFITLLMLLIGARIILQIILLLLVPAAILFAAGYIATITLQVLGIIIGVSIGLVALFFAAYLGGVVDIFAYTVYTYTFLDLTSEKILSARDVIQEE